jgi:MSHA biogenesis protein MshI
MDVMLKWMAREKKLPGWLAASFNEDSLLYAHAQFTQAGRSPVTAYGSREIGGAKHATEKLAREMRLERYQCTTLLRQGEYQMLLVEAPTVPPDELKSAMRWKVKELIDYHVDDATIDVLDIPPEDPTVTRGHMMYAVCARNEAVQQCIKRFEESRIALSVIDIPETAQRNIAALHEQEDRGVALVYFGEDWGLLTINFRSELYLARRLEVGLKQLAQASESARQDALERVGLELQRTFDHFERQFRYVPLAKLLVAPLPENTGLAAFLAANIALQVAEVDLAQVLAFDGAGPDAAAQWRLFHHFGAALRNESKAL